MNEIIRYRPAVYKFYNFSCTLKIKNAHCDALATPSGGQDPQVGN